MTRRTYSAEGERKARLVAAFARKHLIHVDGELPPRGVAFEPIEFAGFQLDNIIYPIFANLDRYGRRRIKKALIGLPRDGAKSEIAAVIVLAIAFLEPKFKGQYYFVARDKEQARAVFDKVSTMILHDPLLRRACDVMKDKVVIKETKAIFQVLPGDAKAVQSKHADVCVIDEYHVNKNDAVLNAMSSGMIGNWDKGALLLVISTAGSERKGPLWDLLARWRKDKTAHVYWCGATDDDDGTDPKVWRKANPMPWISLAALKEAYATLPFPEFERYHLNRFPTVGTNRAYSGALWHACKGRAEFEPDLPVVLGLDASLTRDTTALVADQLHKDGFHHVRSWVWGDNRPMGDIDHAVVEATILELCRDFTVPRIVCDPSYFRASMTRLQDEFGLPVETYGQSDQRMANASMTLYDVLLEGRMAHGGDKELTEAVLNCGVKPTAYGWRITKVSEGMKIDAAVALAMAAFVAEGEASAPSFAETGGVWTL